MHCGDNRVIDAVLGQPRHWIADVEGIGQQLLGQLRCEFAGLVLSAQCGELGADAGARYGGRVNFRPGATCCSTARMLCRRAKSSVSAMLAQVCA